MRPAFVILAAGRGTRIGRVGKLLHKALVPLDGKAVISHIIGLAPSNANIFVMLGHEAIQVKNYLDMAHPDLGISYVVVEGWDEPGGGPGASLLAAKKFISDRDLIFTSCDTLWEKDMTLWQSDESWSAIADVPPGTPPERWCRMETNLFEVTGILDKVPNVPNCRQAYTGLSMVKERHLDAFWAGVEGGGLLDGEVQVTGGLRNLVVTKSLKGRNIRWTDVGDAEAYRAAVARNSGYDFTKLGEATYVLPEQGRVVKFHHTPDVINARAERAFSLGDAVPQVIDVSKHLLTYKYTPGVTGYRAANKTVVTALLEWAEDNEYLWRPVPIPPDVAASAGMAFYYHKTIDRVNMLDESLRDQCWDALNRVNFDQLAHDVIPGVFHGDFNLGNIILNNGDFTGIDWRENFAGYQHWGDIRYDWGKLLAGMLVHWENAQRGDFRPWYEGYVYADVVRNFFDDRKDIEIIGALSLINSAPLHAAPLDEILVARGVAWLMEAT